MVSPYFCHFQPVGQPVGADLEVHKQMPPLPPCPGMEGAEWDRTGGAGGRAGVTENLPFPQQAESSLMILPMSTSRTWTRPGKQGVGPDPPILLSMAVRLETSLT